MFFLSECYLDLTVHSFKLARQLQLEEDAHTRRLYEQQRLQMEGQGQNSQHYVEGDLANGRIPGPVERGRSENARYRPPPGSATPLDKKKKKEKGDCVIM